MTENLIDRKITMDEVNLLVALTAGAIAASTSYLYLRAQLREKLEEKKKENAPEVPEGYTIAQPEPTKTAKEVYDWMAASAEERKRIAEEKKAKGETVDPSWYGAEQW